MIRLADLTEARAYEIDDFWQKHLSHETSIPHFSNALSHAVALSGDKTIAYGQVKIFAEAILILDPSVRLRERATAVQLLMQKAIQDSKAAGIKDIYAFIRDPNFSLLIQNRYGFTPVVNRGEMLVRKEG